MAIPAEDKAASTASASVSHGPTKGRYATTDCSWFSLAHSTTDVARSDVAPEETTAPKWLPARVAPSRKADCVQTDSFYDHPARALMPIGHKALIA